jgi:hypothetical protein
MKSVKNQRDYSNNPGLMFARGVESIISDHLFHPGKYAAQQASIKKRVANKQESLGNFFILLMRKLPVGCHVS